MRKFPIKGLTIATLFLLASCIKGPMEPEECLYKLRVELDFIDTRPIIDTELLNLTIISTTQGPFSFRSSVNTDIYGKDLELDSDTYHFISYETADNVTVTDNVVAVATHADGKAKQPGHFSGGAALGTVLPNVASQLLHVPLHLQRRELVVQIKFTGEGVPYIKDINGLLDGIAISRTINNGFEPIDKIGRPHAITAGEIDYLFKPHEKMAQTFEARNFLLGLDGRTKQLLHLSANTTLGIIKDYELDVTQSIAEFHTKNVHEPWYIVLELNLDTKLEMTIEDWKTGPQSDLIAQ